MAGVVVNLPEEEVEELHPHSRNRIRGLAVIILTEKLLTMRQEVLVFWPKFKPLVVLTPVKNSDKTHVKILCEQFK